ncbi:MAG: NAD(P)-dependent oxidoreductase [Pyrinomonadaceae bacterium]
MRILVTGGSGYLGTHVRRLLGADDLSRRTGTDILNPNDAARVADYDVVVHLAAHLDKSPAAATQTFLTNVEGTGNLLREMKEDAIFIFASTKDVYGRFADNYAAVPENCPTNYAGQTALEWSKLIAERYVEYYANSIGFRSCIFRLSTVYGPASEGNTPNFVGHYAEAINTGDRLQLPGGGKPKRDLLHVDDLAAACTAFTESIIRHGLYNLGGGHANSVSLSELVTKMEEASDLQAVLDDDTPLPPPVPLNYVSDLSLVGQELGWKPTIDLPTGLRTLFNI